MIGIQPIDQYARAFDNPTAKPMFAVVLIDTGAADLDRARLAALPFPVTFAIDPAAPYRAIDVSVAGTKLGARVNSVAPGVADDSTVTCRAPAAIDAWFALVRTALAAQPARSAAVHTRCRFGSTTR